MTTFIYVALKLLSVSNNKTTSFLSTFCNLSAVKHIAVMTATEYFSIYEL